MRLSQLQTGTRILGAFAIVSLTIVLICAVALWRMHAADAATHDLVDNKLAREQITSELLGLARLNGVRTITIARSDSLELADYFQAELGQGEKSVAALETRLAALPAAPAERALADAAAQHKAAWLEVRKQVFQLKEFGKTQEAEQMSAGPLAQAFAAYTSALDALLDFQTRQAQAMAAASAGDFLLSRSLLLAFGGAALVLGGVAGWLLTRSIVAPLQEAVGLAERVARGDLGATIAHARGDEIGRLFDALNGMTGGVSSTVVKVLDSARHIDAASSDIAAGNHDLARRTEGQVRRLQETVQAMEALTDAVRQNHGNAHDANALALAASNVAQQGASAVGQMVERMDTIRQSAARIGDITAMIDGIAFQTNILALNAAVEAARAGAEGRGFAVVAAEVRNLAQHSVAAAKEIKLLVGESSGAIEAGTGIAGAAGDTMRQILERVRQVADLLGGIDAASSAQAASLTQVRRVIAEMDQATRQDAALVEQAAAAAASMRSQAERLTGVVATFRVGDAAGQAATGYDVDADATGFNGAAGAAGRAALTLAAPAGA